MKKILLYPIIILTISCSLAKPEKATEQMGLYWKFYQNKEYDSLRTFYSPNGAGYEERLNTLIEELTKADVRFGSVKEIKLIKTESENSLEEGKSVLLQYNVIYQNAIIPHRIKFKERSNIYKINSHTVDL